MQTFDESQHPRGQGGRFTEKPKSEPGQLDLNQTPTPLNSFVESLEHGEATAHLPGPQLAGFLMGLTRAINHQTETERNHRFNTMTSGLQADQLGTIADNLEQLAGRFREQQQTNQTH